MVCYQCKSCQRVASTEPQPSLIPGRQPTLKIECRNRDCENWKKTVFTSNVPDAENDEQIAAYYQVYEDIAPECRIYGKLTKMEREAANLGHYAAQVGDARLAMQVGDLEQQISKTLAEALRTLQNRQEGV